MKYYARWWIKYYVCDEWSRLKNNEWNTMQDDGWNIMQDNDWNVIEYDE
jgi:hypothetical protein